MDTLVRRPMVSRIRAMPRGRVRAGASTRVAIAKKPRTARAKRNVATGRQHDGKRKQGNPHSDGYSCRFASGKLELEEFATLANGRPSILRCIWRGMYRVRTREGDAANSELKTRGLREIVYRYTQQGGRSIYQMVNRMLAKAKGRDLKDTTKARDWTINLVMAVRLLWSEEGPSKVYRGVRNADLRIYERAKASGELVQWDAFSSTSTSREVAERFRGKHGVLFVVRRDPYHAAAADISEYSQFPDEHEVLLLPQMRFHVLDIHQKDGFSEVVLDESFIYPTEL